MGSGLGEFWGNWIELYKQEKEDLEDMVNDKVKQALQEKYNFPLEGDILQAIRELEKLAVGKYRNVDYSWQDSFSKVWWSVRHEIDMFEEGEESPLNTVSCNGAKRWIERWKDLYIPY